MGILLRAVAPASALLIATVASYAQGGAIAARPATGDVTLDNVAFKGPDGGLTIKTIAIKATNVSKDEAAKLFSQSASAEDVAAILIKMKAQSLSMPDIAADGPDAHFNLHDLLLTGIDSGKIAALSLAGVDGHGKAGDAAIDVKAGQLDIKNADLSRLVAVLKSGKFEDANFKFEAFSWKSIEASFPDNTAVAKKPGGNLVKLAVASLTSDTSYDGDLLAKTAGKLDHLVIALAPDSSAAAQLKAFGVESLDVGATFAAGYDKTKKVLSVDDYTINAANLGSLGLKGQIAAFEPVAFTGDSKQRIAAMSGAQLASLSLRYADASLLAKALAFFAQQQKKTADDVRKEWAGMAVQFLPLVLGGDPSALKIAQAVSDFIGKPSVLTISAKAKGAPVKFTDFITMSDPKQLLSKVDISATAGN